MGLGMVLMSALVSCSNDQASCDNADGGSAAGCPFHAGATGPAGEGGRAKSLQEWWPNRLDLGVLRQHSAKSNPMGEDFDYRAAFSAVDYVRVVP